MRSVIIIGASGHGKVVADIIQKSGDRVQGFLDDNIELPDKFIGLPVLGTVDKYKDYMNSVEFIIAIGSASVRESIVVKMQGVSWHTAIHPTAAISGIGVSIAEGTVVMANAIINSDSCIGKHCIVNSGAIVEHDNQIHDYVHLSVGAKLAGNVIVGKGAWIGIGANVINNISICQDCVIGAGAVVHKDICKVGTYIGVPAKEVRYEEGLPII